MTALTLGQIDVKTYSDLITQVGQFYNFAWLMLVGCGALMLGIIGVLIPYITHQYQKRIFKIEEDKFIEKIDFKITTLKKELKDELLEELKIEIVQIMEEKATQLHDKQSKMEFSLRGSSCLLQANVRMTQDTNKGATMDYIAAVIFFLDSDDYNQIEPILRTILDICLPKLSQNEVVELKNLFSGMSNKIKEKDKHGSFSNLSNEINNRIKELTVNREG